MSNSSYNSYSQPRQIQGKEKMMVSQCVFWKSVKHEDEFDMNIDYTYIHTYIHTDLDDTYIIFV